ncbi:MAG: hypothetical protein D3908_16450 [Candidatus Electrothrix sp. AUS4]|nr:hypothetical protein [Candidatus Electrothrix sp. AUS4]
MIQLLKGKYQGEKISVKLADKKISLPIKPAFPVPKPPLYNIFASSCCFCSVGGAFFRCIHHGKKTSKADTAAYKAF